eukprot:1465861-Lingulodinium_polyedra.AAC.1
MPPPLPIAPRLRVRQHRRSGTHTAFCSITLGRKRAAPSGCLCFTRFRMQPVERYVVEKPPLCRSGHGPG